MTVAVAVLVVLAVLAVLAVLLIPVAVAAGFFYRKTRILENQLKSLMQSNYSRTAQAQEAPPPSQEPQLYMSLTKSSIYDNGETNEGLALENLGHNGPDTGSPDSNAVYTALVKPEQIYAQIQTPRGEAGTGSESAYDI